MKDKELRAQIDTYIRLQNEVEEARRIYDRSISLRLANCPHCGVEGDMVSFNIKVRIPETPCWKPQGRVRCLNCLTLLSNDLHEEADLAREEKE